DSVTGRPTRAAFAGQRRRCPPRGRCGRHGTRPSTAQVPRSGTRMPTLLDAEECGGELVLRWEADKENAVGDHVVIIERLQRENPRVFHNRRSDLSAQRSAAAAYTRLLKPGLGIGLLAVGR